MPHLPSFNSRPSCDGRQVNGLCNFAITRFQFTPVLRRATSRAATALANQPFQFTPVLRRATGVGRLCNLAAIVSIHARLATGDTRPRKRRRGTSRFNSRPSCDGRPLHVPFHARLGVSIHARLATGDPAEWFNDVARFMFQFTPVLRRATAGSLSSFA